VPATTRFLRTSREGNETAMNDAKKLIATQRAEFEAGSHAARVALEADRVRHAERIAGEREKFSADWKKTEQGLAAEIAKVKEDHRRMAEAVMDEELKVGLYKLNPVDPYLESTWFQPLNL
jgi:hypothetical protein